MNKPVDAKQKFMQEQEAELHPAATLPAVQNDPFLNIIDRVAENPDIPSDKLEQLLNMQIKILDRQAEEAFSQAMTRAQGEMPQVVKDATNKQTSSNYAKLEAISKAITPIYTKHGFSITFSEVKSEVDGCIRVQGILRHSAGHKEVHHVDVPLDREGIKGNVNKTLVHATGSSFSYGRRYLKCMIFDVATADDDDGNGSQITTLNEKQIENLEKHIEDTGADKAKLLEMLQLESIDEIEQRHFQMVWVAVSAKAKDKKPAEKKDGAE